MMNFVNKFKGFRVWNTVISGFNNGVSNDISLEPFNIFLLEITV